MKKCPVCDKEFPDSMRFCQVDGTPLVDNAPAAPPEDPYKTTVGRQEDIAAAIPPVDPFATMVNTSFGREDKKDADGLLQLPEEKNDPLKTMYASESEIRREMEKDKSGASSTVSVPPIAAEKSETASDDAFTPPAPPIFNEPNITPPNFNDTPLSEQKTAIVSNPFNEPERDSSASGFSGLGEQKTEIVPNPFNEPPKQDYSSPFDDKPASPFDQSPASPFDSKTADNFGGGTGPIPSPFDNSMPPAYQTPSAPLPDYKESERESSSPKYEEPPVGQSYNNSPFDNPPATPGAMAGSSLGNEQNWNPPPVPDPQWQNQEIGQNTPLQPPVVGGENNTLAFVSLALGLLSFLCLSLLGSIPAIITGMMQKKKIREFPGQYGGSGLATAGIILGAINIVLTVLGVILWVILVLSSIR